MDTGGHELQELTDRECQELLAGEEFGRLGLVDAGLPEIFPVNYALDEAGCVLFRTAVGTKLASAVNRRVIFEVDHIDRGQHSGWSVIVHGVAHHTQTVRLGSRPLAPWLPGKPHLIRITTLSVTGRRLSPRN